MHRRLAQITALLLLVLATAACEVRTTVDLTVEEDGSGRVEVAVSLDDEALAEVPDLDGDGVSGPADLTALLRVDDLTAAGWTVGEPSEEDDVTWVRATKPFGTVDEAVTVLGEVTGAEGAFRDLSLERSTGFGSTSFTFEGTADLSGGLEAFGDAGLAQVLDSEPLGEDVAAIEQRLGQPLSEVFGLEVTVDLPGSVSGGTYDQVDGGGARWSLRLGESEPLEATSTVRDIAPLALAGVSALSALALLVVVGLRLRRRP